MKILSIDFDYFQDVTREQLDLFPDGIDHPTALSEIIWASHYANSEKQLNAIGIMENELELLEQLLLEQLCDVPVMITNSHKHIYDFICEHDNNTPMELVNADMHHDIVNHNPDLDCGNWITHLSNRQKENQNGLLFSWLANPVSLDMFGLDDLFGKNGRAEELLKASFAELEGQSFDLIYLCRSDTWTPPHLDKYFIELCDVIKSNFENIWIENGIDKPRTEYLKLAKIIAEANRKFKNTQERSLPL